jgi:prolyl oligopeptidase
MRQVTVVLIALASLVTQAAEFPETRSEDTVNTYHEVRVEDPYQWLEDWSSEEVKAWSGVQNAAAREVLDALPHRDAIAARVTEVLGDSDNYYSAERIGDQAWFIKDAPPKQQPYLVQIDASGDIASERVIFDPETFDKSGATSMQWHRVSPDGKRVAIALTVSGSEVADLNIFDTRTGERVDEVVPRVNVPTAGGDMSWDADSSGFYYTRYPRAGEKSAEDQNFYQQLWHRELGTPLSEDTYEIGRNFDRIAEIRVERHDESGKLLATVQFGDSGQFELYVRDHDGSWHQVANYEDELVQATFIDQDALLVLSRHEAPKGKFVRMDISDLPETNMTLLLPEAEDALASDFYGDPTFIVHREKIYAKMQLGGPQELRVFDLKGVPQAAPQMGVVGLGQIVPWGDGVRVRQYSYLSPNSWIIFDGVHTSRHPLSTTSPVDFDGFKVTREFATSLDGTQVPVNIIMAEETERDGSNPLLLTGYGGYGITLSPYFNPTRKIWLEQGGIIAIANLRGGGEFGEDWHRQGMLTKKQNVFDDFHGVMRYLVKAGYTSEKRLAIEGGSNGGLLMGAMLTQHASDFHAVISHVGIYDSLRFGLSPNGAFNIPEFGSVEDPEQFQALYAYSPYHRVKTSSFPATLFMTGENDGRVDPMHSRKMTAMLQAKNTSDNPVLLRISSNTGHGIGTPLDEIISAVVDRLAFLFRSLDMEYQPRH